MRAQLKGGGTVAIDVAWLRRHFAGSPVSVEAVYGDEDARPDPSFLKAAAVLLPIVARPDELTVLFTRRTAHLRAHSGQISFPGGRIEESDASEQAAALRETHEEIGIAASSIEVIGRLADYHTRTGFRVTPVVGFVSGDFGLELDRTELGEAFEVPLSFVLDRANHRPRERTFAGVTDLGTAVPAFRLRRRLEIGELGEHVSLLAALK